MRLDRKCFNGNFFNLKFNYPPHPERVAWEYDKANKDLITKAINAFDRDKKLSERLFNETLLHVMSNFISNKRMDFDDEEPPWFDRKIKNLIKLKNQIYKDTPDLESNYNCQLQYIQELINTKINQVQKYTRICHIIYLIKMSILKNISFF